MDLEATGGLGVRFEHDTLKMQLFRLVHGVYVEHCKNGRNSVESFWRLAGLPCMYYPWPWGSGGVDVKMISLLNGSFLSIFEI